MPCSCKPASWMRGPESCARAFGATPIEYHPHVSPHKRAYVAADPIDAELMLGFLRSAGIEAELRGWFLWGGRGELPVTDDTAPSLWVREADYARALGLIREFREADINSYRKCPACGEPVETVFAQCWNCGAAAAGS